MKRSLFIAIAVLIVMALFVGCKAEIADRDELGTVSVADISRSLKVDSEFGLDVANLYWFYTAVKTDGGFFITGQKTELTPVKEENNQPAKGLAGTSLGSYSTGAWSFSFYGYVKADQSGDFALYQSGIPVTITSGQNKTIDITLSKGVGMPSATLAIEDLTYTYVNAAGKQLTLFVSEGTTNLFTLQATGDENGTATFASEASVEISAGTHNLDLVVKYGDLVVGSNNGILEAMVGHNYTIKDNVAPGIPVIEETGTASTGQAVFNAEAGTS